MGGVPAARANARRADYAESVVGKGLPWSNQGVSEGRSTMPGHMLIDAYDTALFDLDGVIYLGPDPIPGAPEAIAGLRKHGKPVMFVTNNAARPSGQVAAQLTALGVDAAEADVVTSAQAGARMLAEELPAGSKVLVVGTENLADQVRAVGMDVVSKADERPDAIIQGYDPQLSWPRLDEAALAVQAGARWFACNLDKTRPTNRGLVPGAGAAIYAVGLTVRTEPMVAGKPFRPLLREAILRTGAKHPIFVGDRLDTDIVGAHNASMDSLMVFTGAHGKLDLVAATPPERPTYIGSNVQALLEAPRVAEVGTEQATCGGAVARLADGSIVLDAIPGTLEGQLDALWAIANLAWANPEAETVHVLGQLTEVR